MNKKNIKDSQNFITSKRNVDKTYKKLLYKKDNRKLAQKNIIYK